ncbi:MAG: ATPase [Verrucomicrobia bacterium]|nr:ATPase [Verrucomicrobiota bacterium]
MGRFIGRESEMQKLGLLLKKKSSSLVVIHGRRRIGKSRLAEEFGSNHRFISLSGLPITGSITAQDQRNEFMRQLSIKYGVPKIESDDWGNLFWILASISQSGRVVILLDEISWMAHKDDTFLGKLKINWDQHFSKNPELILILCGSVSSWIEENILSSTSFLGRISLDIMLRELSLSECRKFWPKRISSYEVLKVLAITGGVPKYLEEIVSELSAENNIRNLCFNPDGILFREFDQIFSDLFKKRAKYHQEIVKTLAGGAQNLDEICKKLSIEKSGNISQDLHHLQQAGFIQIDATWNLKEKITSRLKRFRLSDNYIRFYLKYILPRQEQILSGTMQLQTVESLPGWLTTLGLQFENLILANKLSLFSKLDISPDSVVHSGPFFQRKTKILDGCQIDLMIQTKTKNLYLCEIKFSENPIGSSVIKDVEDKLKRLTVPRLYSIRPVLIHVNGVTDAVKDSGLFDHIIDFQTLL